MKRFLLVALMVFTGVSLYSCATTKNSLTSTPMPIPLPENVQIVSPDPNLPPEITAFSGKWSGRWEWQNRRNNDGVDAVLIVEKIINEQQAVIVTASGDSRAWNIDRSWTRTTGNFSKSEEGITLMVDSQKTNNKIRYRTKGDQLTGIMEATGGRGAIIITMERIP